ncbi:MAG: 6-bladed beta-propeller [Gemmatimonadales bacterium]
MHKLGGIVLGMLACAMGCEGGGGMRAQVTDSAGVALIANQGDDRPLPWAFEPVLTLGGDDEGPTAFYRVGRGAVATDAEGNILVLDQDNFRVVVFDDTGRHLRTLGRRGGGPGEFQFPFYVLPNADGGVTVADVGRNGLMQFDRAGRPLDILTLPGWYGGRVTHDGHSLILGRQTTINDTLFEQVVRFEGDTLRPLVSWRSPPTRPVDLGCVQLSGMPQLFAPRFIWATGQGWVAVAGGDDYRIDLHDSTGLVRSIRRAVPVRSATHDLAVQDIGENFRVQFGGGGGCAAPAARVVEARGVAPVIPPIAAVAVGPDGILWVQRRVVRGETASVDVFDAEGVYLGTLPDGSPFPAAFQANGDVLAVVADDLDVQRVVVYRVHRGT